MSQQIIEMHNGNFIHFARQYISIAVRCWLALFVLLLAAPWAAAAEMAQANSEQVVLEVFVRDGCTHCTMAKAYLPEFSSTRPWLSVKLRQLDSDAGVRDDLVRHSKNAGIWPPGVPTFVANGRVLVGFESPGQTGPELAALVEQHATAAKDIETKLFGTLSVSRLGLPLFTLAIGLLDGLNPCAMWVLLFLLSILVHVHSRKRMALIAGTFVLASGLVYYAFMAAWLNVFLLMGMSTALRNVLGVVAVIIGAINIRDFLFQGKSFRLSIPESAKPGLYARMRTVAQTTALLPALLAVAVLAIVVNFIELLCTAGFPAIYTAILAQQELGASAHYAYLGLYILGYIADDALMVATAVFMLSSRKLSERGGRWLKFISGAFILLLGLILISRPEWLV